MAKKTEVTVENKLRALYDLQLIDSRIDEIKNLRGELPLEVEDLENEIAGLNTRLDKVKTEIKRTNTTLQSKNKPLKRLKNYSRNMRRN
jgi:peptidoglycan hydrolase CwlO-like protein